MLPPVLFQEASRTLRLTPGRVTPTDTGGVEPIALYTGWGSQRSEDAGEEDGDTVGDGMDTGGEGRDDSADGAPRTRKTVVFHE